MFHFGRAIGALGELCSAPTDIYIGVFKNHTAESIEA